MDDLKNNGADACDDGRTVADMSAEWMPWNRGLRGYFGKRRRKTKEKTKNTVNKKEFRAAVAGQYLAMLPALLCILAAFTLLYFLLRLWLLH